MFYETQAVKDLALLDNLTFQLLMEFANSV